MSDKKDNRFKPEPVKTIARLTLEQRHVMLAGLLSHKDLFLTARHRLKPEYFNQADETYLRAPWVAALNLANRGEYEALFNNRAAAYTSMGVECGALFENQPNLYQASQYQALLSQDPNRPGFLHYTFQVSQPSEFDPAYIGQLLIDFLRERSINDEFRRIAAESAGKVITDVSGVMSKLRDQELDLNAINEDPVESGAPEGWLPPPTQRKRIGIAWLDSLLRGGHAAPETYGLLGVTGAGKTTLGLQILASCALREQAMASDSEAGRLLREAAGMEADEPYEMGHCYYFHYEMPIAEIRKKLWSCMAMIDIDRIEKIGTRGFKLSTSAELQADEQYILKMAADQAGVKMQDFPGELERLEAACKQIRRNMWLVDCSGAKENPRRGTGFLPELHSILHNESTKKGRKVACVLIDYAGACVDRHTTDHDLHYALLSQFGRVAEEQISKPFNTPVWCLHQLAAAEGNRTSAVKQSHANAGGSKRFAENLWFCFSIGTADPKTGCRYLNVSKARRANLGNPPIIKVAGPFNRLVDVSSIFKQSPSGKFVLKDDGGFSFKPPGINLSAEDTDEDEEEVVDESAGTEEGSKGQAPI